MKRIRWIAGGLLAGLTLIAGCSSFETGSCDGGGFFSRLCSRRPRVTSDGPIVDGPMLEDPGACCTPGFGTPAPAFIAPQPQPAMPPAGQSGLPPLVPTPALTPQQAQPVPAGPTATTRTLR